MVLLGLTGSIGMGKSTVAKMFADEDIAVYDADVGVHRIYAKGGPAVRPVEQAFPGVTVGGAIDRARLSAKVVGDSDAMARLERIVHPRLSADRRAFLDRAAAKRAALVVLDIPLLYETGGEDKVDLVAVVSAPAAAQRERVLRRPGMTAEKFEAILARQTPDAEKRRRADFVIDTSGTLADTRAQVRDVIKKATARDARD